MMKLLVEIEKIQCANAKLSRRTGMKFAIALFEDVTHPQIGTSVFLVTRWKRIVIADGGEGEREAEDVRIWDCEFSLSGIKNHISYIYNGALVHSWTLNRISYYAISFS